MQIIKQVNNIPSLHGVVVTVGAFDGVHLGHLRILEEVKKLAQQAEKDSVVITFHPHPQQALHPQQDFMQISDIDAKIACMQKVGIDYLIVIPFTSEFSQLSAKQFIKEIIINKIGASMLVMGPNHTLGKDRVGSRNNLVTLCNEMGLKTTIVEELKIDDQPVRSTAIRNFIKNGETDKAKKMLGVRFLNIDSNRQFS